MPEKALQIDPQLYRKVMGQFATGVTIVTTRVGDRIHGMAANSFVSVSLDPPLVLVSIAKKAKMHEYLKASGTYGISILHEGQQELCQHFAGRPIEGLTVAFEDIDGIPVIKDALAHITAEIVDAHEAGDHTLFIGRVRYIDYKEGLHPLLFCQGRYGQVSKSSETEH